MATLMSALDVARAWRPQEFGRRQIRHVIDPIVEPIWDGPRVLIAVERGVASPFHEGEPFDGPPEVMAELVSAAGTSSVVLDGHLTARALETGEGATIEVHQEQPGMARRMFGTLLGGRRRDLDELREQEAEAARQTRDVITGRGGPVAFVAIDLLWLDGQSLLDVPLLERKRQLDSALQESQLVRRGTYVRPSARGSLVAWKALGFGALAYKAANSRYLPGQRNDAWVTVPISTVVRPTG